VTFSQFVAQLWQRRMKTITELKEDEFDESLARGETPVVVDFFAPWCGPCIMLAPLLDQLAEHFAGRIRFYKINVDHAPALAERFRITGVPTLMMIKDGEVLNTIVGFPTPQVLARKLHALLEKNTTEARV
jgi:thioredoxin 1